MPPLMDVDAFGMTRRERFARTVHKSSWPDTKKKFKAAQAVGQDLTKILFDQTTADLSLALDNGTVIPAHRAILAARSSVFRTMLCGTMRESTQQQVRIGEVDELSMRSLLEFMYTGQIDHFAEVCACDATSTEDTCECNSVRLVGVACAADMYEVDMLSHVEEEAQKLENPCIFDVLRRLPAGDLGPAASCIRETCVTLIADTFEDEELASEVDLETLPPKVLVEIMGRLRARLVAYQSR